MSAITPVVPHMPSQWRIGRHLIEENLDSAKDVLDDPRGILHIWEAPDHRSDYIMSLDPTQGITGWSRYNKRVNDHKTDNAAIQILKVNAYKVPIIDPETEKPRYDKHTKQIETIWVDKQVAEWFAPVDAVMSARVASVLGRLFKGRAEEYCELIYESWPGPGVLTTQELLRLNYTNLWEWEYIADSVAESTGRLGWRSNVQSQQALWNRTKRHLMQGRVEINSPWLLGELRDAVIDPNKMRAVAAYGTHDDLIQALGMACWAGHKWTYDVDQVPLPVEEEIIDWQRRAPDFDEPRSWKDDMRAIVDSWG